MIVIATLSSETALALLRNRYEIIFHDCFTTVIANRHTHRKRERAFRNFDFLSDHLSERSCTVLKYYTLKFAMRE